MGKQKVVSKVIGPAEIVRALQSGSITIAQAQAMFSGVLPIGGYRGIAAILDLDLLVNQPLALPELVYSLDKIDVRDAITCQLAVGDVPATAHVLATLVVPDDELWILYNVDVDCPVTAIAGEIIAATFRLSIWPYPDIRGGVAVHAAGRSYWPAIHIPTATSAAAINETVIFNAQINLGVQLRLPGGSILTLDAYSTGDALTAAVPAVTLIPYGRKVKVLVEE